jgi:nucleotide-binding universal stress UspA family protein
MSVNLILVAVDFSPVSDHVYAVAAELAGRIGAGVLVLNVTEPEVDYVGVAPPQAYVIGEEAARKAAEARLAAAREQFAAAGVRCDAVHRWGLPVGTILEEADRCGAGVIVLGSHGHGAFYNLLVGSVAEGVLRHARVPVLVVPSPAKPLPQAGQISEESRAAATR